MTPNTLHFAVVDGVGTLTLARPHRKNAIDIAMREEMLSVLRQAGRDPALKVLIVTGADGNFSSGGDIAAMMDSASRGESTAQARRQRLLDVHDLVQELLQFDRPVIAAVEGVAYGAGFALALSADLVVAASDARFCLSFARIGLVPDFGAFYTLPRVVGLQRAKELVFSAREIGAAEAQSLGIVLETCGAGRALERASTIARALTQASPVALSIAKRALNVSQTSDLRTMLMLEADGQGIAMSTSYHQECVERFLNKQKPAFSWPES